VWWQCCLALLFVGLAVTAPAAREYRTAEFESLKVTIDSDWVGRATPGYLPVRFEITNLGDARVLEIVAQGTRFFRMGRSAGSQGSSAIRQSVRLAKGDRVRLTIPVPIFADNESIVFQIRENNRTIQRFNYGGFQSRVAPADASALIVVDPGSTVGAIASRLARHVSTRSSGGGGGVTITSSGGVRTSTSVTLTGTVAGSTGSSGGAPALDFLIEPSRLPTNWLGFTSVRAVVIGPTEWEQLTDGQKSALLTWTACGGELMFVDGTLSTLLPSAKSEPTSDPNRVVSRHLFGRIHALSSSSLVATGLSSVLSAMDGEKAREIFWTLPANTAPDWGAIESRGFRLRIPGIDGVPARVYLSILFLFALLIGPVNYWLLWRKRRQVLLVLTAPLISAVFIVLLAGYAVAGEGFGVQGRAVTFTMLDQVSKQAATRATASLYASGMTPAGGLRFARDVAVFPIGVDGVGTRDRLSLDLTDAQQFGGGVLQVRSPTNFEQVTFRPARERLTFQRESSGLSVTNGLEATVGLLLYREGDSVYRLEGPLAPGDKRTMTGGAASAQPALPAGIGIAAKFLSLFKDLPQGAYLAVLDRSPFWEPGVQGLTERGSLHLVQGWPEGQR